MANLDKFHYYLESAGLDKKPHQLEGVEWCLSNEHHGHATAALALARWRLHAAGAAAAVVGAAAHRKLAQTVAEEGITLLKNDNLRLPLMGLGSTIKTIAVVGPNADNAHSHLGIYGTDDPKGGVRTLLNATLAAANASDNKWIVKYEKGSCLGGTPGCPCNSDWDGDNQSVHDFDPNWMNQPIADYAMPCDVGYTGRIPFAVKLAKEESILLTLWRQVPLMVP